ncbi:MAG: hypothetical protein ACRESE_02535 [Gammaproteobacteria bacterium]
MTQPDQKPASVFSNCNFNPLFGGSSVSALGDQFTLVALPWLVLKLTGDPAALGIVLAVMALPRAAFMLIGGGWWLRSPRFDAQLQFTRPDSAYFVKQPKQERRQSIVKYAYKNKDIRSPQWPVKHPDT